MSCGKEKGEISEQAIDNTELSTLIVKSPPFKSNLANADFEFRCNKQGCGFRCSIDSENWEECNGSISYYNLAEGVHSFNVYAIDAYGNVDNTPANYTWTVDITPPQVFFVNKPSLKTVQTSAVFELACSESDCRYECSIDSSDFTECEENIQYSGLSKGTHIFQVKATDAAGNSQPAPSEFSWDVVATTVSVYPFDGQKEVPLATSIFITFSEPIDEATLNSGLVVNVDSSSVSGVLQVSQDKKSAKFVPSAPLPPAKLCQVILNGVTSEDGIPFVLPANGIISTFYTASDRVYYGDGLSVISVEPLQENFYDFSTIRISFSDILEPASVVKGSSFIFKRVYDDSEVAGTLIVNSNKIVFDPDTDLEPDVEYKLELTAGIKAINGEQLTPYTLSMYPIGTVLFMVLGNDTSPDIDDTAGDPDILPSSALTGEKVNSSVISSRLLGTSRTYLQGLLKAEIRMPMNGSDVIPIVIRKGQIISATGIDIKLAGEIDTQLRTGNISLYLISDSTGYITASPFYNLNNDAPPAIYLKLDNCITASNGVVNSILNQDLIDIGLYGEVTVQGENMVIDALGTTELNVMGAEKASVTLTLRLAGTSQPAPVDTTPPLISSIYPSGTSVPLDSKIIITFTEPVKESTLSGKISVTFGGGTPVQGSLISDGSSVIFKPNNLLIPNYAYQVTISPGIEDLNGNANPYQQVFNFNTEVFFNNNPNALLVSSIYPGVPCVLSNANPSPPGDAGECYSLDHDTYKFSKFTLPINKNISVIFTKPVNPNSVNETSFVITDKATSQAVPGSRIVNYKKVEFIPNNPWVLGKEYELKLVGGSDTNCNAGEICGTDGRPLNTDILYDTGSGGQNISAETPGGGNSARSAIVIPFIAVDSSSDVELTLNLYPYSDVNSNGVRDAMETAFGVNSATLSTLGGLVNLTTYLSGTLITKMGEYNSDPTNPNTIPMRIPVGNWMFGTEIYFSLLITIDTDRTVMRPAQEAVGYIKKPDPTDTDQRPIVDITMNTWMNAVNDNNGDAYLQDEPNTELITMTIRGRISFIYDGRMVTQLTNPSDITGIEMTVPILGQLPATINAGNLNVRASTMPVKQ
jgi:hypothetical protein